MSVQYSDGPVHVSPDDFQATESGITYAIKFRVMGQIGETLALILEFIDEDWIISSILDGNVNANIAKAGGPQAYAENVIRPAVKAWLANQKPIPVREVAAIVGKWVAL